MNQFESAFKIYSQQKNVFNNRRIIKELQESGNLFEVFLVNDVLSHWKAKIIGPKDTCYEDGIFFVDIVIPQDYPLKPPKMKFDTKIWHPNICSVTGAIC